MSRSRGKPAVQLVVSLIEVCISNADALLREAELLFDKGFFARSFYLSSICVEEIGKVSMLGVCLQYDEENQAFWDMFWQNFRDHSFKTYKADVSELHNELEFDVDYGALSQEAKRKHSEKLSALYAGLGKNKAWAPSDHFNADKARAVLEESSKKMEVVLKRRKLGAYELKFQKELKNFFEQSAVRELHTSFLEGKLLPGQYVQGLSDVASQSKETSSMLVELVRELAGVMTTSGTPP